MSWDHEHGIPWDKIQHPLETNSAANPPLWLIVIGLAAVCLILESLT